MAGKLQYFTRKLRGVITPPRRLLRRDSTKKNPKPNSKHVTIGQHPVSLKNIHINHSRYGQHPVAGFADDCLLQN